MPAVITHQLFGEAVAGLIGDDAFTTVDERNAFLLGNQGPDPLFYILRSKELVRVKRLGSIMHRTGGKRFLAAMSDYSSRIRKQEQGVTQAFICGYICHYVLDRTAHPLIFDYQFALQNSGIEELEDAGSQIHGQIEADLDSMMLYRVRGVDITRYRPYEDTIRGSAKLLDIIDGLFRFGVASAYQTALPQGTYRCAVQDMRTSLRALYSPGGVKRQLLGIGERLVRSHSLAQAMSHRTDVGSVCEWDNREHAKWADPFTGEESTASFDDLYHQALGEALDAIETFRNGGDATGVFDGRDFRGKRKD